MRIAPNVSNTFEVGTAFHSDSSPWFPDPTFLRTNLGLKFDVAPWSTSKLKSNPALRRETDPAAIDAPVISPVTLDVSIELRSGKTALVSSTQRPPPDEEEWLFTFVRNTPIKP